MHISVCVCVCVAALILTWESTSTCLLASFPFLSFPFLSFPFIPGFLYEKEILEPWYYKWIHWMGQTSDKSFHYLWREEWDAQHRSVDPLPFRSSVGHFYEKNRELELGLDWFYGLKRAASVYFPVHLLSLVLRWRTLANLEDSFMDSR